MRRSLLSATLFTLATAFASASTKPASPAPRLASFPGDRAAAISYTFDDGLRDQYTHAAPMLDEFGFKGTFFVIPGRVSPSVEDAERRRNDKRAWGTITWDELRDLAARGHEIGNHTWSHRSLPKLAPYEVEEELGKACAEIKKEIGRAPLTVAFPFNQDTPEVQVAALKQHIAFRDYQTGVGGAKTTVESLTAWTDKQVRERRWGVVMAHGIVRGYAAFTDPEILRAHLRHVNTRAHEIWVDTFAAVASYVQARDSARLEVSSAAPGRVVFVLSAPAGSAPDLIPLTVSLDTPAVKAARAERAGLALPIRVTPDAIQLEIIPSSQPVTLAWQ